MDRPEIRDEVRLHLGRAVSCYTSANSSGPDVVAAITETARVLDSMMIEAVSGARADGATWAELGHVLGTTRQAVHKRFGQEADVPGGRVTVTASRRHELRDLNALGAQGYRLTRVGMRRLELLHVGTPHEHARAVGISDEARRLVEDGWTVVGWRFPDVFFGREVARGREPDGSPVQHTPG